MTTPAHCLALQLLLCLLAAACSATTCAAKDFVQNFRGRPFDPQQFRPTGSNPSKVIRSEPQGLRITLPADAAVKQPVGVVPKFRVHGDFEITMTFEIIQIDKPTKGNGAGVSIWFSMVSDTKEAASIARQCKPSGNHIFLTHRASTPVGERRRHYGGAPLASDAQSGKLRLVRTGALLSYQVALGDSGQFQELYQSELGTNDLDMVRFAADNGGSPTLVDVRIKDVRIRSEDPPPPALAAPPANRRWVWVAGVLGILVFAVGVMIWFFCARNTNERVVTQQKAKTPAP